MTIPQKDTSLGASLYQFDDKLTKEKLGLRLTCLRRVVENKSIEFLFSLLICISIWILFANGFSFLSGKICNKGAQAVFRELACFLLLKESYMK